MVPTNVAIDKIIAKLRENAIDESDATKKEAIEKEIADLKSKKT
jgi:hypothetical protein|tara:strand:- start:1239 stop:1370 length:132 start_codon:yes stop_codon:yes gene_type:complete